LARPALRLIEINEDVSASWRNAPMWQPIATAPFDCELELAVIDGHEPHAVVFPCRRVLNGWIDAETKQKIELWPTHWRPWGASS
jgi:hypothetical protein